MLPLGIRLTLLIGPTVPVPAPLAIAEAIQNVVVTQSDEGRSGFQISFLAGRNGGPSLDYSLLSSPLLKPFSRVILIVTLNAQPKVLMDGIITHHQLSPGNGQTPATFGITGEDVSVMMDLDQKSVEHPALDDELIAAEIIADYEEYGLVPIVIPGGFSEIPLPVERVPLQQGTDLEYLQQLAARNGYVFYIDPGPVPFVNTAYWGPPNRDSLPQKSLVVNQGSATNVTDIQFTYEPLRPTLITGQVLDFLTNEELPVDTLVSTRIPPLASEPALLANFPNVRRTQLNEAGLDVIEAYALAQSITNSSTDDVVTASGQLDVVRYGGVLSARGLVGVRGVGYSYDGYYYVKSVTHNLTKGSFTQSFTLTREGLGSTTPVVFPP